MGGFWQAMQLKQKGKLVWGARINVNRCAVAGYFDGFDISGGQYCGMALLR
jgi:hypothetical protein